MKTVLAMNRFILSFLFLFILLFPSARVLAQYGDTTDVRISGWKLQPGTVSNRNTGTYHDMTSSWDSSPYTEGHLREGNAFRMNFRLLFPVNHDPSYQPGYPLIVMMHGGEEGGDCNTKCKNDERYRNNDNNLSHGGLLHLQARNLAAGKYPDDPTLHPRAFPGFVLFPQNTDGLWDGNTVKYAVRLIRLLIKKHNIDQDRIYIHGLSKGGQATVKALFTADWLFAAAAPMSPIAWDGDDSVHPKIQNIPTWFFQGGRDGQPTPAQTELFIRKLREAGATVRYTLYPNLAHGTWNDAYNEPDFFTWLLSKRKSNIHIDYSNPNICGTNGVGPTLRLPANFLAYQWERDGQIIPGATTHTYVATVPGVYRARFSRKSATPSGSEWNRWSDPVTIAEQTPPPPVVKHTGSLILADLNGNSSVLVTVPEGYAKYTWTLNNGNVPGSTIYPGPTPNVVEIRGCGTNDGCGKNGAYRLIVEGFDKCPSPPSEPLYINSGTLDVAREVAPPPSDFTADIISSTQVRLRWQDNSPNERGFEIWRRKRLSGDGISVSSGWVLVTLTPEDMTVFLDEGLEPGAEYWYKIRGVNNEGRSDYAPGKDPTAAHSLVVTMPGSSQVPSPPFNLTAQPQGLNAMRLTWEAPANNPGIKQYVIEYNGNTIQTNSNATSYVITSGLALNTVYTFTVKAESIIGIFSPPSSPAVANTYKNGLFYKHSTDAWSSLDEPSMQASFQNPEYTGWVPNFTLDVRTQDNFFNFEFEGYLYIQNGGNYTFYLNSDDGSRLWIDDNPNPVVDFDGLHGCNGNCDTGAGVSGSRSLTAGAHKIRVQYFERDGGEALKVRYRGPDTNNNTVLIPDIRLTSGTPPTPPPPISVPTNVMATGTGMQTIVLTWNYPLSEIEIQRALSDSGPFATISRASQTQFEDTDLTPGTTYYYQLRAISGSSLSPFTAVVSATTTQDNVAPTQPGVPEQLSKGFSTVAFQWTASQDNVGVKGYEVFANGELIGFTAINSFQASDLEPATSYTFRVEALDLNDNRSTPSPNFTTTTNAGRVYVTTGANAPLNSLSSWRDGSDHAPTNFNHNGQIFRVLHSSSTNGDWSVEGPVSKVVIEDNVTVTASQATNAKVEIPGNGIIILNSPTVPEFVNLSSASTVRYNNAKTIRHAEYGNLNLTSTGNYNFPAGDLTIKGTLSAATGSAIKGVSGNATRLNIGGNLQVAGTPAPMSDAYTVDARFIGNGNHTINVGTTLNLFRISKTGAGQISFESGTPGVPATLNLGSAAGGGLSLPSGVEFNMGNNNVSIVGSGTINTSGETGMIASSNGKLSITSNASSSSRLYFKPGASTLHTLTQELTGSGKLYAENQLRISDGLKIRAGDLYSQGNVVLLSTSENTANLQEIEGNGKVVGDMVVQRYFNNKPRVYRYISGSVKNLKVADWQQWFHITGTFGGASTGPGLSNQPSLFIREPEGWVAYPSSAQTNQDPIVPGRGYTAFVRNNSAFTLEVAGEPNQGTIPLPVFPRQNGDEVNDWNLVGNPYPATINWGQAAGWTKNGIASIIAVRDNANTASGKFQYFDSNSGLGNEQNILAGGRIAPGQAFWVKATSLSPSLSINEKAKDNGQQNFYRDGGSATSHLHIRLAQGQKTDGALLMLTSHGNDFFDADYDGLKMANEGLFNLSTLTENNREVAINNLSDAFCSKTVPIRIDNATAGSYVLQILSPETLFGTGSMVLKDKFLNSEIQVDDETSYSFAITADAASYRDRFELTFSRPELSTAITARAFTTCEESAQVTLKGTQAGASYTLRLGNNEISESITSIGNDITFEVPLSKLNHGQNAINVEAAFRGCSSAVVPNIVSVTRYEKPVVQAQDLAICAGTSATLEVNSTGDVASYEWHDRNGKIEGATGARYTTGPLFDIEGFLVYGKTPDGCLSEPTAVFVEVDEVEIPQILLLNDTLYSTAFGNEYIWSLNGTEITTDRSQNFIVPASNGSYTLTVAKGGCRQTSRAFVVTGVAELSADNSFAVYPNPTTTDNINLHVRVYGKENISVRILDVLGREYRVRTESTEEPSVLAVKPVQRLKPGVYFMAIGDGSDARTIKFIVEER